MTRPPSLVIGLGNELLQDEGVGVVALRKLADLELFDDVELLEGGTLGLALAPEIEGRTNLVLLDAVRDGERKPGSVVVLEGDEVPRAQRLSLSVHEVGVVDMLGAAEFAGRAPVNVALVGAVPAALGVGIGLSPGLERAAEDMAARTIEILLRWKGGKHA